MSQLGRVLSRVFRLKSRLGIGYHSGHPCISSALRVDCLHIRRNTPSFARVSVPVQCHRPLHSTSTTAREQNDDDDRDRRLAAQPNTLTPAPSDMSSSNLKEHLDSGHQSDDTQTPAAQPEAPDGSSAENQSDLDGSPTPSKESHPTKPPPPPPFHPPKPVKAKNIRRLPYDVVIPALEFPRPPLELLRRSFRTSWRVFRSRTRFFLEPRNMMGIGISTLAVLGIGWVEGLQYFPPGAADVPEVVDFCSRYAVDQAFAAFAGETTDMESIEYKALLPEELRKCVEADPRPLDVIRFQNIRIALTQLVMVTQILRLVNVGFRIRDTFQNQVRRGTKPPLPMGQRVIRLCGRASDTCELSLERYGISHILPVMEEPGSIRELVKRYSDDGKRPFWWCVPAGAYGREESWRNLVSYSIRPSTLLPRPQQPPVLLIEADATNTERALGFGGVSSDLSVTEAVMSMRLIPQLAKATSLSGIRFEPIRVFIGYTDQPIKTGGGGVQRVRDRLLQHDEADIFIDASVPLLLQILRWIINVGSREWHRTIIFDTDDAASFRQVHDLLAAYGFNVIDESAATAIVRHHIPRFVYHRTTDKTVHELETVVMHELTTPELCCALLDRADGLESVKRLRLQGYPVHAICSAEIFDDLLRAVRFWIRKGESVADIQRELDLRFGEVQTLAREAAHHHKHRGGKH